MYLTNWYEREFLIKQGKSPVITIKKTEWTIIFFYFGQVKQWQSKDEFVWAGRWMFPVGSLNLHSFHGFSADINLYWEITAGNWSTNVAFEEKQVEYTSHQN